MNIVEIVDLGALEGSEGAKIEISFRSSADFALEILPSIFKTRAFAGAGLVWIDPGVSYVRPAGKGANEKRNVRIPVRVCSSGYDPAVSDVILYAVSGGCVFSRSDGKSYSVKLRKTKDAEHGEGRKASDESTETRPNDYCYHAKPVREISGLSANYAFAPEDGSSEGAKVASLSARP